MREPATYDLTVYKGSDFEETFTFTDSAGVAINLTGWNAQAQIRRRKSRSSELLATFLVRIDTPASGVVVISLTDDQTAEITRSSGYWDLLLSNLDGFDEIYVTGKVTFEETVTVKISGTVDSLPMITLVASGT